MAAVGAKRAGGRRGCAPGRSHQGVHHAKGEVPDGEQHGTCEHQEAGVAKGEFEASTKTRALSTLFSVRPGVWLRVDAVADAGHGGDDPGFAEAFAQSGDRDAHGVGERVCVLITLALRLFGADDTAVGGD